MTYLQHPNHGRKIAYAVTEAKLDKLNGWKEVTKDEYYTVSQKINNERVKEKLVQAPSKKNVESAGKASKKNSLT